MGVSAPYLSTLVFGLLSNTSSKGTSNPDWCVASSQDDKRSLEQSNDDDANIASVKTRHTAVPASSTSGGSATPSADTLLWPSFRSACAKASRLHAVKTDKTSSDDLKKAYSNVDDLRLQFSEGLVQSILPLPASRAGKPLVDLFAKFDKVPTPSDFDDDTLWQLAGKKPWAGEEDEELGLLHLKQEYAAATHNYRKT